MSFKANLDNVQIETSLSPDDLGHTAEKDRADASGLRAGVGATAVKGAKREGDA